MDTPLISFISINYNGMKDTCELIESLQSNIYSITYEIIIVDNASINNEAHILRQKYPSIIVIRSNINLGFSGGNNLGIKSSKGKYLFFINNDTYIKNENGLNYLINLLETQPQIGGISPKIKFAFPPQNIQFAGYTKLSSVTLRNALIGFNQADKDEYNKAAITPYLHGAAMIVKKSVINKIGLMPEIYFLYYEELDWCTQITKKGYELWYSPAWTIYHKESQSTGQYSKLKTFYLTRNRLLYAWRNLHGIHIWISIIYQISIPIFKKTFVFLIKGRLDLIYSTVKGVISFILLTNKKKDIKH